MNDDQDKQNLLRELAALQAGVKRMAERGSHLLQALEKSVDAYNVLLNGALVVDDAKLQRASAIMREVMGEVMAARAVKARM